jgi:DNA-binding CsgD family transcriptional regulator
MATALYDRGTALTPRQREVLRLQAYGMSYEEISNHLGLSVWTVKNHHKQAVRSLQISLTVYPSDRVRTTLACYIMGLLDGGVPPLEVVRRLREARERHPAIEHSLDDGEPLEVPSGSTAAD